jgi:hypothetical protein
MILPRALSLALLLAAGPLAAQTAASAAPAAPVPSDLDDLRAALEGALGRGTHGSVGLLVALRPAGHAYRLKNYGAFIVLAPRVVPGRHVLVRTIVDPIVDLAALEREMDSQMAAQAEVLHQMEAAQRDWTRAGEEQMRVHLRLVEDQAEAFRAEAERAKREAERAVRTRFAPPVPPAPPMPPAALAAPAPPAPSAPSAPVVPIVSVAPVAPVVSVAPAAAVEPPSDVAVPEPPEPPEPPAPPPWRFWLDTPEAPDAPEAPDPARVVASVRAALANGLAAYRRPLVSLRPDEFVTVAVDFVSNRPLRAVPTRTLMLRLRVRDLQDRQAGRLSASELGQRIEFEEN